MNSQTRSSSPARNLAIAGLLLAIGIVLPYLFMLFGTEPGKIFSPMDLTILLGGLILGWRYGLALGIVTPILSSVLTHMPPLFPIAITMMFQLGVMGLVTGLLRNKVNNFINVVIAEIIANIVYAIVLVILLGMGHHHVAIEGALFGVFVKGFPGILLQWIIIPYLAKVLKKAGVYNG